MSPSLEKQEQQEQKPLGVIVPLLMEPNNAGWLEFASLATRYGSRLRFIASINIDKPDYSDPFLDGGIRQLATAGIKVIANLYLNDDFYENRHLVINYIRHYPKLSGINLIDPHDNIDRTQMVVDLAKFAKDIGYETVVVTLNVFNNNRNGMNMEDELRLGTKYLASTAKSHHIDIIMYYFYHEIPWPINLLKNEHYGSEKFAIALSKREVPSIQSFETLVRALVRRHDVARYVYIEGGMDTVPGRGMLSNNYFRHLSPYLETTLQQLDSVARLEERLNRPLNSKKIRKKRMVPSLVDDFGIKKQYTDREVPISRQKLWLHHNTVSYDETNDGLLRGGSAITNEFGPKAAMQNMEWTCYLKFIEKDRKNVRLEPDTPLYQLALRVGDKTKGYDVNITYGGFIRVGKVFDGIQSRFRPGNGTNFPLDNWLGVKICLHQYPSSDNPGNSDPVTRIEVFFDEHAYDRQGNIVIGSVEQQAERWRSAFTTEDTGNWIFDTNVVRKTAKTVKDIAKIRPKLKVPLRGQIVATIFRTAPGCRVDARFMSIREIDPLRED